VARALVAKTKPAVGGFFEPCSPPPPRRYPARQSQALATLARDVFAVAASHRPGTSMVRLIAGPDPKLPEMVVVAVNDDRPFLYDSALLAAIASGARIRARYHPVVT